MYWSCKLALLHKTQPKHWQSILINLQHSESDPTTHSWVLSSSDWQYSSPVELGEPVGAAIIRARNWFFSLGPLQFWGIGNRESIPKVGIDSNKGNQLLFKSFFLSTKMMEQVKYWHNFTLIYFQAVQSVCLTTDLWTSVVMESYVFLW